MEYVGKVVEEVTYMIKSNKNIEPIYLKLIVKDDECYLEMVD